MFISMRKTAKTVDRVLKCAAKPVDQKLARREMQDDSIEFMRLYRRKRIADMKISRSFDLAVAPKFVHRQAA